MNKLYTLLILLFSTLNAKSQIYDYNYNLTFDSSNLIVQYSWGFSHDTTCSDTILLQIDTMSCHRNQWQIGKPQKTIFNAAYSYPNAIVTDTIHPCLPNDTSIFIYKVYEMPNGGLFSLKYQLDIDSGDIATIEVSKDFGSSWQNIADTSFVIDFGFGVPKPNLFVSTTGWNVINMYNIYTTIGAMYPYLLFKFTLITGNDTTPRDGWIIDNIFVGIYAESLPKIAKNNTILFFPNPTTTTLNITSPQPINQVNITNLIGQTLLNQVYNSDKVQIDVSTLQTGIYFIKINGTDVQRFLKE